MASNTHLDQRQLDEANQAMVAAATERLVARAILARTVRAAERQARLERVGTFLWRASLAVVAALSVVLLSILAWTTLVPHR